MENKLMLRIVIRHDIIGEPMHYIDVINELGLNDKILIFDIDELNTTIFFNNGLQKVENIINLNEAISIEKIPNYIEKYKPNYLFIDDIQLLKVKNDNQNIIRILKSFVNDYNITIWLIGYANNNDIENHYMLKYDLCDSITILNIDGTISNFK